MYANHVGSLERDPLQLNIKHLSPSQYFEQNAGGSLVPQLKEVLSGAKHPPKPPYKHPPRKLHLAEKR